MIYLSGKVDVRLLESPNTGFMLQPGMGNRPDLTGIRFAVDTGCYANPDGFTVEKYMRYLDWLCQYRESCLFVTAPDVYGDGIRTIEQATPVLPMIRSLGFPAALVIQPNIGVSDIPWNDIDAVFVGGPNEWQRSETVREIGRVTQSRGVWLHRGRVNSLRRLQSSLVSGYDSADGTILAFGPDRHLPRVQRWMQTLREQPALEGIG